MTEHDVCIIINIPKNIRPRILHGLLNDPGTAAVIAGMPGDRKLPWYLQEKGIIIQ
jgi:hypothetical protein